MAFRYCRNGDRLTTGSWVMVTGSARTGYAPTNVDDSDPSNPFWGNETTVRIAKDFGGAQRVDEVYLFAHNLANASVVKVQMHTSSSWATPDVSVTAVIPAAYEDGFLPGVRVDVAAAYPTIGDRTKQWISIVNTVANGESVYLGEVWIQAVAARTLQCESPKWGPRQAAQRLTARSTSKRGVHTVYDYGSTERKFRAEFPAREQDYDDLRSLELDARFDARPIIVLLNDASAKVRHAEPLLVRINKTLTDTPEMFGLTSVIMDLDELGRGELLGA